MNCQLSLLSELNAFKGFKVLSLNVRSLLPKINILRLDLGDIHFDVLALSETWLKPDISDALISLDGYRLV